MESSVDSVGNIRRNYHTLKIGNESFNLDVRYTNLKKIGKGSYGFVCSIQMCV